MNQYLSLVFLPKKTFYSSTKYDSKLTINGSFASFKLQPSNQPIPTNQSINVIFQRGLNKQLLQQGPLRGEQLNGKSRG